jgi:hypothetical protein
MTRRESIAAWARSLGAVALLAIGLDHLEQLTIGNYSSVPTIGTLFVLNVISAAVVAALLAVPWRRLSARAERLMPPLLALGGIGIAAGSLVGLLISENGGLFGFRETGYRSAIVLAIVLDAAAIVLLTTFLVAARTPGRRPALHRARTA